MLFKSFVISLALTGFPAFSETLILQPGNSFTIGSSTIQCESQTQSFYRPLFCKDDFITNRFTGQPLSHLGVSCINKTTGWLYCDDNLMKGPNGNAIGPSMVNEANCLNSIQGKLACNDRYLYNFEGKMLTEKLTFDGCKADHKDSTFCYGLSLRDWNGNHLEQYSSVADCLSQMY